MTHCHPTLRHLWRDHRALLGGLLLMFVFRSAWADWVVVPTGSMNPTILEGDRVLVNKHVYGLRVPFSRLHLTAGADPTRGDIVVFDSPTTGVSLVKRVAAVPGDTVELVDEQLIVNGEPAGYAAAPGDAVAGLLATTRERSPTALIESSGGRAHPILLLPGRTAPATMPSLRVPAGRYFMLGDNRDNSADSRYVGFVARERIVGRADRVVVSLDPEHHWLPRAGRWLLPLQ